MYPYRQQGAGGLLNPISIPGGRQGQYPGHPGQGNGGGIDDRLDLLERQYERLNRKVDRLERKVDRLERQLGYHAQI